MTNNTLKSTILVTTFALAAFVQLPLHAEDALPAPGSVPLAKGVPASSVAAGGQVFVPDAGAPVPGAMPVAGTAVTGTSASAPLLDPPVQPQVVKDAVSGLQKTDAINLDDMVRAQDAINRLDLLVEIEKRQLELKKLRDERTKPAALGAAIPASALSLPPMAGQQAPVRKRSSDEEGDSFSSSSSSSSSFDKYSIQRITGTDSRYTAVLMYDTDKTASVKSGEKLPDGTQVKSVTLTSVTLVKGKKSKTLTISSDSYIVRGSSGVSE